MYELRRSSSQEQDTTKVHLSHAKKMKTKSHLALLSTALVTSSLLFPTGVYGYAEDPVEEHEVHEDHPDPNEEHYDEMIYVGRLHDDGTTRVGWHEPNGTSITSL